MLHLKQTLHNTLKKTLLIIQHTKQICSLHGLSPKLAVSGELGILLFCPMWLAHSSVNGSDIYPKFVVY